MKNICLFLSETWHAVYFCAKAAEGRSKTKRICKWLVPKGTSIPFVCLFVCLFVMGRSFFCGGERKCLTCLVDLLGCVEGDVLPFYHGKSSFFTTIW